METTPERLTRYSHGAGCACKIAPGVLAEALRTLTPVDRPEVLVDSRTGDDAAVWRLQADRALVVTTDFITPVVDDARDWGRIAATNAVSDVYAMGGRPFLALNLVAWNTAELPTELLAEVLGGAEDVARSAGFALVGGHSVDDPVPKFGLAVVGEVHPERMLTNAGLRPGDLLVLTKALGVGVITTGVKAGVAEPESVAAAVNSMKTLNDRAAETAIAAGATGATDVTGFGLLGHLGRMAAESGVDVEIDTGAVPLLPGAAELAAAGVVPGGSRRNLAHVEPRLRLRGVDEVVVTLLADAQTSGGLVFGAAPGRAEEAVANLRDCGLPAAVVGRAVDGDGDGVMTLHP